jgi:hypothetical protein
MTPNELKSKILEAIFAEITEQISSETKMIQSARETANSDTKSSAGDKYETTTAMMHLEQEKFSKQLAETLELEQRANSITIDGEYSTIKLGAIAETSMGNFFISISADDVEIDDIEYTPISLLSPIGLSLKGKKESDSFIFREQNVKINTVY